MKTANPVTVPAAVATAKSILAGRLSILGGIELTPRNIKHLDESWPFFVFNPANEVKHFSEPSCRPLLYRGHNLFSEKHDEDAAMALSADLTPLDP